MASNNELDERQREVTAYHEAGHAVMTIHLKQHLEEVRLDPPFSQGQRIDFDPLRPRSSEERHRLECEIRILWAGQLAEERFTGKKNPCGWSYDCKEITEMAAWIYDSVDQEEREEELKNQSFLTLQECGVWRAVELVAAALIERDRLTGDEVRELYLAAMREPIAEMRTQSATRA